MEVYLCTVITVDTYCSCYDCRWSCTVIKPLILRRSSLDGWMTCHFMPFSTVFRSYQDDERMILKAVCNGTLFTVEKILPGAGLKLRTARSAGQRLTHGATGLQLSRGYS